MVRLVALASLGLVVGSCAVASGVVVIPAGIDVAVLAGDVGPGGGTIGKQASERLTARSHAALVASTHDAIAAALAAPGDAWLQRRAATMIRLAGRDANLDEHEVDRVLAQDIAASACTGLADSGATRSALGDATRAGDAYLREARECTSFEAAAAAATPLRASGRCNDEIAVVRELWPKLDRPAAGVAVALLDAVAECSDDVTLRQNLDFVPPLVVDDYFALRRHRAAVARARMQVAQCHSECAAAESSCGASTASYAFCQEIEHACRADCGGAP